MAHLASVAAVTHRFDEAGAWMAQALLADPLDVGVNMNLGDPMMLQRRWAEAATAQQRALELAPTHRPSQLRPAWVLAPTFEALHGDLRFEALAALPPPPLGGQVQRGFGADERLTAKAPTG